MKYRTPAQRALTLRRAERTRRANSIKRLVADISNGRFPVNDSALPFWRDTVLVDEVRRLVQIVRDEWGWLDHGEP